MGAIASADARALQAPFQSGISIEDYQLDAVVRALQMPRVNLLIADDVIADAEFAFVTSTNLKGHALDQNLEVGCFDHSRSNTALVNGHFHALMANGTLARL